MSTTSSHALDGAWRIQAYDVAGQQQPVEGILLLTVGWWSTLFFVPGDAGDWASAEAGRCDTREGEIVFHHRLVFQGGGNKTQTMSRRATRTEVCRYELNGAALVIDFPSGNRLHLVRQGSDGG